jgi:transcriptional regulator with XRE-family HTH domain
VAEHLSIDTSNYGRIERGQSSISIDRLEKLAKLYKISITELLKEGNKTETLNLKAQESPNAENISHLFITHLKAEVSFLRELLIAKDTQIAYFIEASKENTNTTTKKVI